MSLAHCVAEQVRNYYHPHCRYYCLHYTRNLSKTE